MTPNLAEIEASGEGRVGRHTNAFIPPDTFYMKIVGDLNDEEGKQVNGAHWDIGKDIDGVFFLCDIAELESVGPAVRKEAVEVQKKMNIAGASTTSHHHSQAAAIRTSDVLPESITTVTADSTSGSS